MAIQTINIGTTANDGTGDDPRTAGSKINDNFTNSTHAASRDVGTEDGNLLEANSNYFGLQSYSDFPNGTLIRTSFPSLVVGPSITLKVWGKGYSASLPHLIMVEAYQYGGAWHATSGINLSGNTTNVTIMELDGYVCFWFASTGYWNSFFVEAYDTSNPNSSNSRVTSVENSTKPAGTKVVDIPLTITHNTRNTTIDGSGFIKKASPIVKLYSDKIEPNDYKELESCEFERVGTGHYIIKGAPLLSRDGWYIETLKDRNNNIYFTLDYEELEDGLHIKTYTPDYSTGRATNGAPVDINEGRFVTLRFEEDKAEE